MKLDRIALSLSALFWAATAQADGPEWQQIQSKQNDKSVSTDFKKSLHKVDRLLQNSHWQTAPSENTGNQGLKIYLPTPSGEQIQFVVWESSIMEPGLAEKYPNIKTYKGHQLGKPKNSGRFDLIDGVFHGVYQLDDKKVFIDPQDWKNPSDVYQTYFKSDYAFSAKAKSSKKAFKCNVKGHEHSTLEHIEKSLPKSTAEAINLGDTLRTYRLAVTTTGEYGQYFGTKDKAVAAVVTAINRVNDVFQHDLSVKLELVADNDKVVYVDPASDPFNGNDDGNTLINEVGVELNKTIGSANYDVGHVFSTGGGGLAGLGVVCGDYKAEGVTGSSSPEGDPFWIDYVAHELGHQFNAEHSFNATAGACSSNRSGSWSYEPGSASTIMSYAGICDVENLQNNSDAYFHTTSIEQMKSHITGSADSCAQKSSTGNAIPSVNAGADGFIPKETPFKLTASATDSNASDQLLYVWEQRDLGPASSSVATMVDDGQRPIFRSWMPTANPTRYFPRKQEVLAGGALVKGEAWPTTNRDLNFVATVRDQKGGINSDAVLLKVSASAGPFKSSFPTASANWAPGSKQYAQWDVANTTAAPISCAKVDIKLSFDDGQTFDLLADDTDNDGSELLDLPASKTGDKARFFVECSSQPFFAVTPAFKISTGGASDTENPGGGGSSNAAPRVVADSYTVEQDSSNNRFDLLVNDSDPDGDPISIASVSNISNGATVTISNDKQSVSYAPAQGYSGSSSFDYQVSDGKGASGSGSVTITVNPAASNSAPSARDDSYTVEFNTNNNTFNLLSNDSDPDTGDSLRITAISSVSDGATVTIATNGQSVAYTPATGFSGTATFDYEIQDSQGAKSQAKVTVTVNAAPVTPPSPPIGGGSGGGGGSAGWLLLMLLIARRFVKR